MRSGGNDFNYYPENKLILIKLANLVQLKRMLMFCLEDWGLGPWASHLIYATGCDAGDDGIQLIYV